MDGTIETTRLILRPMRADDLDGLLPVFPGFDATQMRSWIDRNLEHQRHHGYGLFTVVLRATGEIIGDCGLEHMTDDLREAELGYDLRSDVWGQGLATEAATAVKDYARTVLGFARLFSLIQAGNEASRRVAEKVGMDLDETIERFGVPYWVYAMRLQQEQG